MVSHFAENDRPPTHLLIVKDGEQLRDHKTACGLVGVEVPARDGLTRNFLTFNCRACMDTFDTRPIPPEKTQEES